MIEDVDYFREIATRYSPVPTAAVHHDSFLETGALRCGRSVDVLITSPPYLNNYHYIRNTRPQMFWLGLVEDAAEFKPMEQRSFGQFWQTVRSGPTITLTCAIPELVSRIEALRARNPEKGPYGGPGWANYAAAYFNDCERFFQVASAVMRPGGTVIVVIGNNILQGVEFPTDRILAEIAVRAGFRIVDLHEVRKKRTGNSILNSSVRSGTVRQRVRLYETAVELRAP